MRYEIEMNQHGITKYRGTYSAYEAKEIFDSIDWSSLRGRYGFSKTFPVRVRLITEAAPKDDEMFGRRTVVSEKTFA